MTENYKQFDSPTSDKAPIIPDVVQRFTGGRIIGVVLLVVFCVVLVTSTIFMILFFTNKPSIVVEQSVCVSAPCLKSASFVVTNMNQSVDPCTNFYQYACGGYKKNNPIEAEHYEKTILDSMYHENEEKLKSILESPVMNNNENSVERKLKEMFDSCTNTYLKEQAKGYPLLKKVIPNTGGWWVIGTWNSSTWSLQNVLEKVSVDYWTSALFTFRVATDWNDATKRVIELDMSGMSMYWWYYVHPTTRKYAEDLKRFMRNVGNLLVRDSNLTIANTSEKIETFVQDVYFIEHQLANITYNTLPTQDSHDEEKKISLADFTSQTGNVIDFTSLVSYMFRDAGVTGNTKVVLREDDWMRRMVEMIKNLGPNKDRMLNNYLTWKLAHKYVTEMSWEYVHANREFFVDKYGYQNFYGTWYHCYYTIDYYLGDALGSMYVRDHFADENKQKVHEILDYVKKAISDAIVQNMFMDKSTKDAAKDKIMSSLDKMGYPDFMMNDEQLTAIYQYLKITKEDYFQNLLNINKFTAKDWNNRLLSIDDESRWALRTYDTHMAYVWSWHQLIVPAGLLQFPIYDYSLPHYMNFGSMGSLLGHFLVHAIDKYGSRYGKNGQYDPIGWWSNQTQKAYNSTRNCFANYYSNQTMGPYIIPGQLTPQKVPVNGLRDAHESVAITSGVKIAFHAYQNWVAANKIEKVAPGVGLSNEQMFFVAYSQSTCFNRYDRVSYNNAVRGRIPEDIRTNGVMSQLKEFSQAFKCPLNSPMNPVKKCNMY